MGLLDEIRGVNRELVALQRDPRYGLLASSPDRQLEESMRGLLAHNPTRGAYSEGLPLTLGNAVNMAAYMMPGTGTAADAETVFNPEAPAWERALSGVTGSMDITGAGPLAKAGAAGVGLLGGSMALLNRLGGAGEINRAGRMFPKQRGIFIGEDASKRVHAAGHDTVGDVTADKAKELAKQGADKDRIWSETGWYQDVDGQWKTEISDIGAEFNRAAIADLEEFDVEMNDLSREMDRLLEKDKGGSSEYNDLNERHNELWQIKFDRAKKNEHIPMPEVYRHNVLYEAYPQMRNFTVEARDRIYGLLGSMGDTQMRLSTGGRTPGGILGTMTHEAQHGVQHQYPDWARGGAPGGALNQQTAEALRQQILAEPFRVPPEHSALRDVARLDMLRSQPDGDYEIYMLQGGEIEARNAAKRQPMTLQQRRAVPPWLTADRRLEDAFIRDKAQAGGLLAEEIKDIPAPYWNKAAKSVPVGINPTSSEVREIQREATRLYKDDVLRALTPRNLDRGDNALPLYMWPASGALHGDVGAYFKLSPKDYTEALIPIE